MGAPNSTVADELARKCPPEYAFSGMPGCTLIGSEMTEQSFASRSLHPDGIAVLYADEAVQFINDNIGLPV